MTTAVGSDEAVRLTVREVQVLRLLAAGLRNKEIAQQLTISEHTTESHNRRLFRKLGVRSRLQASQRARSLVLIQVSASAEAAPVCALLGGVDGPAYTGTGAQSRASDELVFTQALVSSLSLVVVYGELLLLRQLQPQLPEPLRTLAVETIDRAAQLARGVDALPTPG